ncbi:hypothetical protein ACPXBC_29465, partial [Escherichia coli]|uniref:hypothetical protein n=1 Tax=Escherichia coli TaxID=562 RepID=UPI003CE4CF53
MFDAVAAGLAETNDPFIASPDAFEVARSLFGGPIDLLLHAGTHKASEARFGANASALNPGSPNLPADGERPSFLRLKV